MAFPDTDLDVVVEAFLGADPTADPGTWPAATDLSSRLLDRTITLTTGRRQNQRTAAAGSCTFWLDNDDGALTPELATSTYYPDWDLGCPVRLSVDNVGASPPYPQFCGFVADITAEMVPGAGGQNISAVRVTIGGVLRRLGQGSVAKSALRRYIESEDPAAYWTMDTATSGTTEMGAEHTDGDGVVPEWATASMSDVLEPGWTSTGRTVLVRPISDGAMISAAQITTAVAINYMISGRPNELGDAPGFTLVLRDLNPSTWAIHLSAYWAGGSPDLELAGSLSGLIEAASAADAAKMWDGGAHHIQVYLEQSGSNVSAAAYVDGVLSMSGTAPSITLDGPFLPVLIVGNGADVVWSHVAVWAGAGPAAADFYTAAIGHAGETATARIARNCAQEGIPHVAEDDTDDVTCGPQAIADVLAVLRDAELVGHGFLYETLGTWGLGYLPVPLRYNLQAAATINLATYRATSGESGDVLTPVRNDARIRNEWTISRPRGNSDTALDAAHQAKRGRYNDSADVNVVDDAALLDEASWRTQVGISDRLRYDAVPIDLAANSASPSDLLTPCLDLSLGDRVDRTNHLAQHPVDPVSMTIEGYWDSIRRRSWLRKLVTERFEVPWIVGVYADVAEAPDPDEPKRYDPEGSLVDASFDAGTDTALVVDTSADPWATSGVDFPVDIRVAPVGKTSGGVRLRVTAIGAPSSGVQTITVDQAPVNGIERTIPAGWAVSLWQEARYAL